MLLASDHGSSVELRIVGYQFPSAAATGARDWDANWLVLSGDVRIADGESWLFTEPCLTVWEAQDLLAWLRKAAGGRVAPTETPAAGGEVFAFTEPNLAFSVAARDDDSVVVRVHLSLESAPPSLRGTYPDIGEFFVPITMSPDALHAAATTLDAELTAYPAR